MLDHKPLSTDEAAELLAKLLNSVADSEGLSGAAIKEVIRTRWSRLSHLAHSVHEGVLAAERPRRAVDYAQSGLGWSAD